MNDDQLAILQECLNVSVRLWIDQLAETTFEQRQARAQRCSRVLGEHGAAILYLVPTKRAMKTEVISPEFPEEKIRRNVSTADAFNHLAEGIACAAYQPGGIKCFGLHFEAHERPRKSTKSTSRRRAVEDVRGV